MQLHLEQKGLLVRCLEYLKEFVAKESLSIRDKIKLLSFSGLSISKSSEKEDSEDNDHA